MKQFTVEEYNRRKAEGLNCEVVTRDGREVRILTTELHNKYQPVVAVVAKDSGNERASVYTTSGEHFIDGFTSDADLFFKQDEPEMADIEQGINELDNLFVRDSIEAPEFSHNYDELRAHFAGLAMQSLASPNEMLGKTLDEHIKNAAYYAVKLADALIEELKK